MGFRAQKYFCDLSIRWYESFTQGDLSVGFQRGKDLPVDVETNAYWADMRTDLVWLGLEFYFVPKYFAQFLSEQQKWTEELTSHAAWNAI